MIGEALSLLRPAVYHQAALARCFHKPRRSRASTSWSTHDYAVRAQRRRRARAWLAAARTSRTDFVDPAGDYRRAIGTLDLPVLLVHGRQDAVPFAAHAT